MLGGRKIHPAVMALSYGATFISTSAIVGFGGFAGLFGMSYFKDLPILFIDNYDNISIEYLNKVYDEFQNKKFNLEKLDIKYWESKIKKECKFK